MDTSKLAPEQRMERQFNQMSLMLVIPSAVASSGVICPLEIAACRAAQLFASVVCKF